MEKSNFFIRISKALRKALCFVCPFFALLLAWRSNFEYVKNILLKILSEDTVHIIRLILQYSLGTQSVAMSLQILISYSFIFISISSCTIFVINMVRLLFVVLRKEGIERDNKKQESKNTEIIPVNNCVYLSFSKLII